MTPAATARAIAAGSTPASGITDEQVLTQLLTVGAAATAVLEFCPTQQRTTAHALHTDGTQSCIDCTHRPERTAMTEPLPHDLYIDAVLAALLAAGMEPTDNRTSDTEINRYEGGPDAGCTTQLQALLTWDGDAPGLNTERREDGFILLWEHPAEQWQWAPRGEHGVLNREPEFLAGLSRWASPHDVVTVVRELLAGRPAPEDLRDRWQHHAAAQAAVDAWAAQE
ncbi:hypothetical protein [Streptomyces sp. NBC_00035]|uniref:hypothetical protein n=1 Tax=Streptomyces sp. NBC_00035 TaxID=2903614 RepID=UPI00324A3736